MLIPFSDLARDYGIKPSGVIHCGGHVGEEAEAYAEYVTDPSNVWWIEANPDLIAPLRAAVEPHGQHVIQALLADENDQVFTFHVTNNLMSSSIYELGTHKESSPDVYYVEDKLLRSKTIDTLVDEHGITAATMLNLDLQGAELMALQGAVETLEHIDVVYTEVNHRDVYVGCAKEWEIEDLLKPYGFRRRRTVMAGNAGWGDSLFTKDK